MIFIPLRRRVQPLAFPASSFLAFRQDVKRALERAKSTVPSAYQRGALLERSK